MDGNWNKRWLWALSPFIVLTVAVLWLYDWLWPKREGKR